MTLKFDINDFRTDSVLKTEGVWIDFGGGARIKLASFDNVGFTEAFRKAIKPYADLNRDVPEAEQLNIMCVAMAHHIVLDWENIFDGDKELKHSAAASEKLLKELEPIRDRILQESRNLSNFKQKKVDDTVKN